MIVLVAFYKYGDVAKGEETEEDVMLALLLATMDKENPKQKNK